MWTLYNYSLIRFGKLYRAIEDAVIRMAVAFDWDAYIKGVQQAKEVAMAERVEMLISNIRACNYAFELKSCRNLYQILCLQYPEFHNRYGKLVGDCLERQEKLIIQSFNK